VLLPKFITDKGRYSMLRAYTAMSMKSNNTESRVTNRVYESLKRDLAAMMSEDMKASYKDGRRDAITQSEMMVAEWNSGKRENQREFMKEHSPFNDEETHKKSIETRTKNKTNVWNTNNPMQNPVFVQKKLDSMPDMKGRKCWYNTVTYERTQANEKPGDDWIQQGHNKGTTTKAKGRSKPKIKCEYCDRAMAAHCIPKHIRSYHENKKNN